MALIAAMAAAAATVLILRGDTDETPGTGPKVSPGDLPDDVVAIVEGQGEISREEFDRAFEQAAKQDGLGRVPARGDPKYEALRAQAVNEVLDAAWISGEADMLGVSATDDEVQQRFEQIKMKNFNTEHAYQRFLEDSGFSQEEVHKRVELEVLSTKIQARVTDGLDESEAQAAFASYLKDYRSMWAKRTTCAPAYVIGRCGNGP